MFAEKIKKLRNQKNISQLKLAKMLFISQQAYANYELGKATPTFETLISLSNIFEVSIDYLLDNKTEQFKKFTEQEELLIKGFRLLNRAGQEYLLAQMDYALYKAEYKQIFHDLEEKEA